ncbi:MAG: LysR family transcriptional regulator [Pseudomonadota bacterium]
MQHWNELRTALIVARSGTVQAAASELGVHRATVHRHIDLLEAALGTKLFLRHAKGYVLTEDGGTMLDIANRADEMFLDLEGSVRKRSAAYSGELIVAIFHGLGSILMPAIKEMSEQHPNVRIELVAGETISRLEYGEAHVAFRAGAKPDTPDYVVRPFLHLPFGLYASQDYFAKHGEPSLSKLREHRFVGPSQSAFKRPYTRWLLEHTKPEQFALYTSSRVCIHQAIIAGLGLGFMARFEARQYPNLVEVIPESHKISLQVWSVTHMDLHRTDKIQEFLGIVKSTTSHLERVPEPTS